MKQPLNQLVVDRAQILDELTLVLLREFIPSLEEMSLPGFLRLGNADLVGLSIYLDHITLSTL